VKGDKIPDTEHVARLCYGKAIEDGEVLGAAFLPRPNKEDYLSINWLECLQCPDRASEIVEIRRRYYAKFNLKKKDKVAILNVGTTCSKVADGTDDHRCLSATHEPEPDDDSHSGLWGFSYDDIIIGELILQTVLDFVPAIESP
jgi:hypothetical protein